MFLRPKVRHKDGKEHRREPPPHLRWTAIVVQQDPSARPTTTKDCT
jgi:hypothetical protein